MPPTVDVSNDWQCWDGLEAITYTSRRVTGDSVGAVPFAKRHEMTNRELQASDGVYTAEDIIWIVPANQLTEIMSAGTDTNRRQPKPGDTIYDTDENTWTVLAVAKQVMGSLWRLVTRNLVIAYDLKDIISIERPTLGQDASAATTRSWPPTGGSTVYDSIAAAVQLVTDEIIAERGLLGFKGTYVIFLSQQVTITKEDRVKFGSQYFQILGIRNPTRLDELPVLDVVDLP